MIASVLELLHGKNGITLPLKTGESVLIPVPLACEASTLPFELILLDEIPALHQTSNNINLYCL